MKPQIARSTTWSIPVLVDEDGNMFYQVEPKVKLAVITNQPVELIDCADLHGVTSKLKIAQMKIDRLEREVKESYSSKYLEQYFKAKVVDLPNLDVVNKIVTAYGDWLDTTVCGKSDDKWYKRVNEIKHKELPHIEKDMEIMNVFMEFLTENNAI